LRIVSTSEYTGESEAGAFPAVLHFPNPPDERFAWLRQSPRGPRPALCGVTHTLASPAAVTALGGFLTAPYESSDALICTSRSVERMVRTVLLEYGSYLAERFRGTPPPGPRLEVIPLGVNPDQFRPATPAERQESRSLLRVKAEEVLVLCVGRLSHHAKAHPYPLLRAAEAAAKSGRKVHLMFAGWAAHPSIDQAYRDAAQRFAPSVRTSFVDGQASAIRTAVWRAADVLASLPDNIQETFGLVIVEGMASGLPVLATDWDGYRDLVVSGETGWLVPTAMMPGANANAAVRMLMGQTNYDQFLAECSQSVTVDVRSAEQALTQLVVNETMRQQMGQAGRERVMQHFTWASVIRRYEALWAELEVQRQAAVVAPTRPHLVKYPPVDHTFAGYPTQFWNDSQMLTRGNRVNVLDHSLMRTSSERRVSDPKLLAKTIEESEGKTLAAAVADLIRAGIDDETARATLAWLLKYDVLRCEPQVGSPGSMAGIPPQ
jgi:glycosyltransferase involved in cell wall biosynthesis